MMSTPSQMFKIINTADRGRALTASRTIERGDTILREKPLFTYTHPDNPYVPGLDQLILDAHADLDSDSEKRYAELYISEKKRGHWLDQIPDLKDHPEDSDILSRASTNQFTLQDTPDGGKLVGVVHQGSVFNHSCDPNVAWNWCKVTEEMVFKAAKIEEGDELTVSYIDCLLSERKVRQEKCGRLGFECRCSICRQSTDDPNRVAMCGWISSHGKCATLSLESLKCTREIVNLIEACGLQNEQITPWYDEAADTYESLFKTCELEEERRGYLEEARSWRDKALQLYIVYGDETDPSIMSTQRKIAELDNLLEGKTMSSS